MEFNLSVMFVVKDHHVLMNTPGHGGYGSEDIVLTSHSVHDPAGPAHIQIYVCTI